MVIYDSIEAASQWKRIYSLSCHSAEATEETVYLGLCNKETPAYNYLDSLISNLVSAKNSKPEVA